MSYLIVVVIGAVVGWAAGQNIKGSEMGAMPDVAAGAIGAAVIVLISRLVGISDGFVISFVISIIGGIGVLLLMRRVLKQKPVPVTRPRRR